MKQAFVIMLSGLFLLKVTPVQAHPGRTAADGCHYCRTNCDSWGVAWNERHCHNAEPIESVYIEPTSTPVPTSTPTPTLKSTPKPKKTAKKKQIKKATKKKAKKVNKT